VKKRKRAVKTLWQAVGKERLHHRVHDDKQLVLKKFIIITLKIVERKA
jgi:hypothetical protein